MTRRIVCSPTGMVCGLVVLAMLVVGGLAWVSVASLRVEDSQRISAAQAHAANQERLALWRLDGHMLPRLVLENNRPYSHYSALHAPSDIVIDESGSPTVDPGRVPSPLLGTELPEWVKLHVQIDRNRGWQSPQVIPASLAVRLRAGPLEFNLSNVTPLRATQLEELRTAFPAPRMLNRLAEQDQLQPLDEDYLVPVPLADEPASEKTVPPSEEAVGSMRDSGESWLVTEASKDIRNRFQANLGGTPRRATFSESVPGAVNDSRELEKKQSAPVPVSPSLPTPQVGPPQPLEFNSTVNPGSQKNRELSQAELDRDCAARQLAFNKTMSNRGNYELGNLRAQGNPNPIAPVPSQNPPGDSRTQNSIDNLTNSIQMRANLLTGNNTDYKATNSAKSVTLQESLGERKVELKRASETFFARSKSSTSNEPGTSFAEAKPGPIVAPVAVQIGPMRPRWIADDSGTPHLFLLRSVKLGTQNVYQGVVVDWPKLQAELQAELADLFPAAELHPVDETAHERTMTALPVRLDPGPDAAPVVDGWSPLRSGLVIAWAAAILAIVAVAFGGRAILSMAERRIRFASAVTHELRTPLTAMQLHLDLLNSGLDFDDAKKSEFLATITSEAQRLNQLVENVLDFARLETRSARALARWIPVESVLETIRQTWSERLAIEGFELVVGSMASLKSEVLVDGRVLEQVLGNMIDNARKYAKSATDRRIWLLVKPGASGRLAFEVEDRGPGVPADERRSIFQAFRRGSSSLDTGGAGLGLSLAKQWAELFGGTLSYRPAPGGTGACFRLELAGR